LQQAAHCRVALSFEFPCCCVSSASSAQHPVRARRGEGGGIVGV
jgi:hypothetical protein